MPTKSRVKVTGSDKRSSLLRIIKSFMNHVQEKKTFRILQQKEVISSFDSSLFNCAKLFTGKLERLSPKNIRWASGLYYKTFRIVIYDRNDSTIVEPVL